MSIWLLVILIILLIFLLGEKSLEDKKIYARCFIVTALVMGAIYLIPYILK